MTVTGKCTGNTGGTGDVDCASGDGTTAANTQNKGASVDGTTPAQCCEAVTVTGKCTGNTGGTGDVDCASGDGTTAANTQNKGASVDGTTPAQCCEAVTAPAAAPAPAPAKKTKAPAPAKKTKAPAPAKKKTRAQSTSSSKRYHRRIQHSVHVCAYPRGFFVCHGSIVLKNHCQRKLIYYKNSKKKLNSAKVSNRRLTWRRRRTFVFHQSKKYKKISFLDRIITNWKSK